MPDFCPPDCRLAAEVVAKRRAFETFGCIGGFSAQTNYRADPEKAGPDGLNKYKLIWFGCGNGDPTWYQPNEAISGWLDKNNVKHVWRETPGAHVRPVWHQFLAESTPLLFARSGRH